MTLKTDNEASRLAIEKGVSLKLRYTRRYQRLSVAGLHDAFMGEQSTSTC